MKPESLNLQVRIADTVLPNPVGVASGTFGFGSEYAGLCDLASLGAVYTKAVTLKPRAGNTPPRLAETKSGMLNAIGLANPGLQAFLTDKEPLIASLPCPVIVNVAGDTEEEYAAVTEAVSALDSVKGIELNVSCPNVDVGGMAFGSDVHTLFSLVSTVRKVCRKALIVKLSPNVTDIAEMARSAQDAGADALSCINTVTGMTIDIHSKRSMLHRGTGGLSGPAILPVGVAAVWRVSRAARIPVIGLGGIIKAEDALQYLLAGASAIQVGTALFTNPQSPRQVLEGIQNYMNSGGYRTIEELHGLVTL